MLVELKDTKERFVAKKISLEHMSEEEKVKALNEAKLLRALVHQHITEYLGSFISGNTLHIIMEYCAGGSLQQVMARRERSDERFDEEEIFDWFLQAPPHPQPRTFPRPHLPHLPYTHPAPHTPAPPPPPRRAALPPDQSAPARPPRARRSRWLYRTCTPRRSCTGTSRRPTSSSRSATWSSSATSASPGRWTTRTTLPWSDDAPRQLPAGVNANKLERHLSELQFTEVLGMQRAQFYEMPMREQMRIKQEVGLF